MTLTDVIMNAINNTLDAINFSHRHDDKKDIKFIAKIISECKQELRYEIQGRDEGE